jgi:hypothetical protein
MAKRSEEEREALPRRLTRKEWKALSRQRDRFKEDRFTGNAQLDPILRAARDKSGLINAKD